jgi:hypothetical protein
MNAEPDKEATKNLAAAIVEQRRLRALSNEELCREYLKIEDGDDELHVNEMMNRLWPEWAKRVSNERNGQHDHGHRKALQHQGHDALPVR